MLETFHSRKSDVTTALRDLGSLAERVGARSLAGRLDSDLIQKLLAKLRIIGYHIGD